MNDDGAMRYCGIPIPILVRTWFLGIYLELLVMIPCNLVMNQAVRGDALTKGL